VQAQLAPEFPLDQTTITRQLRDRQIPWFLTMTPSCPPVGSVLSTWFMEYHPRFMAEWHPQVDGVTEGIRRDQILKRYAATLKDAPPQPLLQDVVGMTLAIDTATRAFLTELCLRIGHRSSGEGDATLLEGPEILLRLVPETASGRGIRELVLRVYGAPAGATTLHFGPKSVLSFTGQGTARWSF
jgi:hypothetical protein